MKRQQKADEKPDTGKANTDGWRSIMKTDILIVGSGCAGLYAALNLPRDKKITIITKDIVEHSDSFLGAGAECVC